MVKQFAKNEVSEEKMRKKRSLGLEKGTEMLPKIIQKWIVKGMLKKKLISLIGILILLSGLSLIVLNQIKINSTRIQTPLYILAIGDSVTEGAMDNFSDNHWLKNYNYYLAKKLDEVNAENVFLGHGSNEPGAPNNEGHGGYCISPAKDECVFQNSPIVFKENSLLYHLDEYLEQPSTPNLIILQGGINDISVSFNSDKLGNLNDNFDQYLERTRNRYPEAKIILLPPISSDSSLRLREAIESFSDHLLSKESKSIAYVDCSSVEFEQYFIKDRIHPNEKGYSLMADLIYKKIKERGWVA